MLADKIYTNLRAADVRRLLEYVVELTGIAVIYVGLAKLSLALASIHGSRFALGYRVSPAIYLGALIDWAACLESCRSAGAEAALELGPGTALSRMPHEIKHGWLPSNASQKSGRRCFCGTPSRKLTF
jgi:hypothetical protein